MAHLSFDLRRQYLSKKQFPRLLEELTRAVVDVQPEDILGFISLWALLRRAGDQVTEPSLAHVQELLDEGTCDACTAVCNEVLSSSEKASSVTPGEGSEAYLERALEEAQRLEKRLKDFLRRDERLPRGRVTEAGWLANELHNTARRFSSIHANLVNQTQETHPTAEARQNGFALLSALRREDSVATGECLEQPCDLSLINKEGHTPLTLATSKELSEVSLKLIELNADVNFVTKDGDSALIWASCKGLLEVCKKLLEHHADVNFTDRGGKSPLVWAARNGFPEICEVLLEAKANAAYVSPAGRTPLMWAARSGLKEICGKLLESNANIHQADKDGKTALLWAADENRDEICVDLLAAKADCLQTDKEGRDLLFYAHRRENLASRSPRSLYQRISTRKGTIAFPSSPSRGQQFQCILLRNAALEDELKQAQLRQAALSAEVRRTFQQLADLTRSRRKTTFPPGFSGSLAKYGEMVSERCGSCKVLPTPPGDSSLLDAFSKLDLSLSSQSSETLVCPQCSTLTGDLKRHYEFVLHTCPEAGCTSEQCNLLSHFLVSHCPPSTARCADGGKSQFLQWLSGHFALSAPSFLDILNRVRVFADQAMRNTSGELSYDDVAGIHLCTLDTAARKKVNSVLLDLDGSSRSSEWFSAAGFLDRSLENADPVMGGYMLFRATETPLTEALYEDGQLVVWPMFTSATPN
eukprot:RCo006033